MAKDSLRFTRRLMLVALVFAPAVFAADRFYDEKGRYTGQNRGGRRYDAKGRYTGREDSAGRRYDEKGRYTGRTDSAGRRYDAQGRYTGGVTVQGAAMTPRAATSGAAMTRAFKNETGPKTGRQSTSVLRL